MSNAQLQQTIVHANESSTSSELFALNRGTLVLVLAIAAFVAASWAAMLPGSSADLARPVSFQAQQQSDLRTSAVNPAGDVIAPAATADAGAVETTSVIVDDAASIGAPLITPSP